MSYLISVCDDSSDISELKDYYSSFTSSTTNHLTFNFSVGKYYKVMLSNKIIGFASIVDQDYSFVDLKRFIHPEYRNQAIGNSLLDFIIQDAKNLNKTRLTGAFLGDNKKATNFFKSKGFKVTTGNAFSMVILSLKTV